MVVPGLSSRFQVRERKALASITFPLSTGWYCIEVQDSVLEKYRLSGVVVTGISGASGFAILTYNHICLKQFEFPFSPKSGSL